MLEPLPLDAVSALQAAFARRIDAAVEKAVGPGGEPERREALRTHLIASARFGRSLDPHAAAEMAAKPAAEIDANTRSMRDPLGGFTRGLIRLHGKLRSREARYDAAFGAEDRLYFPLLPQASPVERRVAAALAERGWRVTDYAAGKATDSAGKQQFRIGKLLAGVDAGLAEEFAHDASRTGEALVLCLSRAPLDIARMSTARGWWSCMARNGPNFRYVKRDVRAGTLVAYLVRQSDPELHDPLARILLKPFESRDGHAPATVLVAGKPYGLSNDRFVATAQALAAGLSAQAPSGRYRLTRGLYADSLSESQMHLQPGSPAQGMLDLLGIDWRRDETGALHVDDDLDLSPLKLRCLPDLSAVHVHGRLICAGTPLASLQGMPQRIDGDIYLAGNALTDLKGAPAEVRGNLNVQGNRLVTLEGGPARVGGAFDCGRNRLVDLAGAPQVGGDFICDDNGLRSLRGAPERVPGRFACQNNRLTSLQHGPAAVRHYIAYGNALTDLKGMGSVAIAVDVSQNALVSLEGAPPSIRGQFHCTKNPLRSLQYAPQDFHSLVCDEGVFSGPAQLTAAWRRPPRRGICVEL